MRIKFKKVIITVMLLCFIIVGTSNVYYSAISSSITYAHSGRTDSSGGHKDNKNKSGLGYYHYHHGLSPHLHESGNCPYNSSSKKTKSDSTNSKVSKTDIKSVQKKLNKLGYKCGTADGIMGQKTMKAIKKYQKDNGLTVDGKIGKEVKKSLGIN